MSGFTGRKAFRRLFDKSYFKAPGLTGERGMILSDLRDLGATGTVGVGVKSVDIDRNAKGEGE